MSELLLSEKAIIDASPSVVWRILTVPELMINWMGDPAMELQVNTSWELNSAIRISGIHHGRFVNHGTVLVYEPDKALSYSHLSSASRLPDSPENYSILQFELSPLNGQTILTLRIENFPTATIFQHLRFYWRTAIVKIKRQAEGPEKIVDV